MQRQPDPGGCMKRKKDDGTLVILAGGKSSRMGSDKTFLKYQNESFLVHLIKEGQKTFDQILISAGSQQHGERIRQHLLHHGFVEGQNSDIFTDDRCPGSSITIIPDVYEAIGPMGGLLSVFEQTDADSFAIISVDTPRAEPAVCRALLMELNRTRQLQQISAEPAHREDPSGNHISALMLTLDGNHTEVCIAAYHRTAYDRLKAAYQSRHYSIFRALGQDLIKEIAPEDLVTAYPELADVNFPKAFHNFNTKEDLRIL